MQFLNDPKLQVIEGTDFKISEYSTYYTGEISSEDEAAKILKRANKRIFKEQQKLYASDNHSILIVFQAMDAAGKDSTVSSVFTGVNPAGFKVTSFKAPSKKELDHDFLWRCNAAVPARGMIGIFNRSHYEEVLVCKVHPEYVFGENIPRIDSVDDLTADFWAQRYTSIKNWENHLAMNGTVILKFFLNVGKEEQKARFLSRIEEEKKNWKFNYGDMKERALWPKYMNAYQEAIKNTASEQAPWYVIPADNKPIMRAMVANIVAEKLQSLNLNYPSVGEKEIGEMTKAKKILENK
ncbi:polyphosphate kinase 2 family protein [Bacteroidia bacterium]|nr:polyphosphate kinase 2 family protein [Bacteroidia bacterium]MDB4107063.1 polyphosphate kinase 2 family protein [Bacteroidia bacterium]MDC1395099.1 polyphosphate kinase 2 family protein [Bacteroidia bacterium]